MNDPTASLYNFIFGMVEGQPSFRVGDRKPAAKPLSPAMLARSYKGVLPAEFACEPKIDGVRVIVTVCPETLAVRFVTRNGNELTSLDHLSGWFVRHAQAFGVHTYDCEAVSGSDFYDSVGAVRTDAPATDARLWLLDLPDEGGSYRSRRGRMVWFKFSEAVRLVPSYEGMAPEAAFRQFTAEGYEGVMVKDLDGTYAQGKRSSAWLKVKALETEDLPIVSVHEGTGRLAGTMGYVVVQLSDRLVRVGGGFTDEQRADIWADRDGVVGKFIEVSFQSVTPDGSLRHPRIRGDK